MYSPAGAPGCRCERRARQREGRADRPDRPRGRMLELDDPPGRGQLRVGEQVPDLDDRPARHAMGVQQHQRSSARASLARSTSPTSASSWIRRGLAAKRTSVATAGVNQPSGAGKGRRTERTPATTARARRIREPPRLPNTTGGQTYRLLSMVHAEHPPYPLYALNAMRGETGAVAISAINSGPRKWTTSSRSPKVEAMTSPTLPPHTPPATSAGT